MTKTMRTVGKHGRLCGWCRKWRRRSPAAIPSLFPSSLMPTSLQLNTVSSLLLKIVRPTIRTDRGESRLTRSVMTNWRLGWFFYYHFEGSSSQNQQETNRRLITSKVTFWGFLWLRKINLRIFACKHKLKIRRMNPTEIHCSVYTETT